MENAKKAMMEKGLMAIINAYSVNVDALKKVVVITKEFDGKVYNKNIPARIEAELPLIHVSYHKSYYGGDNFVFEINRWIENVSGYGGENHTLFSVRDCKNGENAFIDGRKFNHAKFKKIADERIAEYTKKISQLENELKNGAAILDEYNALKARMGENCEGLTWEFRELIKENSLTCHAWII